MDIRKKTYTSYVRDAVKDYFKEKYDQILTDEDVNKMYKDEVLYAFLEWEGIIGYTGLIISIMED